jgi:hypothetical protein
VGADRPDDADMPPDDHPDRRDDPARNNPAETRTRQEYYSELRATVSREESAVAQQTTADEQAAAEKWQETSTDSRWIWTEYQRKWPPTEHPAVDRSKDPTGSWRVDGSRVLGVADNSRVDAECDRIAKREEEKISPTMRAIESQDSERRLVGFEDRLKGYDRIKEKVYNGIKLLKHSPEEAVSLVPDTIRYTFQYRESRYTQGIWTDIERLKEEGFKLDKLKNYWSDDKYKGINSTWIEPDTGQRFEVQFHTRISFEAKQLTHTAYERIRSEQADAFEELVLEAFEKKVAADVPVPAGATDIPDYRKGV